MVRIIPKKTKHALSFRLKTSKTKALKQFKGQIKAQAYVWKPECYAFNLSDKNHTRAWLPTAHSSTTYHIMSFFPPGKKGLEYGIYKNTLFGNYAIVFDVFGSLTAKCLCTGLMEVSKSAKKGCFWLRLCCQTPMTARPTDTRMGKGKGAISYWEARLRPGQVWFEFAGLSYTTVSQILISLRKKSPVRIRLIGMSNHATPNQLKV